MTLWLVRRFRKLRARRSLGFVAVALLVTVAILGNATTFYLFDRPTQPDLTYGDALWYSVISITTIGYGDISSSSVGARIGTVVFIVIIGLATFTLLIGMVVDWCTDMAVRGQRGLGRAVAANHVLIVNFPGAARVRQIVEELRSDPHHRKQEIVIVSDQITELPFAYEEVIFIHGSPLDESTYERAQAKEAELALVLATSYSDPASDAVVASAVSVLDGIKAELYIVAECLHEEHRTLFESVRCDAIVPILRIGSNLLVQEAHDPGVTQSIDEITSNLRGDTLFSTEVPSDLDGDYLALIGPLLERDINVLCVARGRQSITRFRGVRPSAGDRVVYIANERQSWDQLRRS